MKTTQVSRKHRSKNPARQAQPKPERMITVAIFSPDIEYCVDQDEDCGLLDLVKFPESVFKRMKNAAKEAGLSLNEFFQQAINEKIANEITSAAASAINAAMGNGGAK